MIYGTDVAVYQGNINWDTYKNARDFAIIKMTGGCPDPGQPDSMYLDPHFNTNKSEARRVNMPRGFYHYAYPEYNSPEAEADYVVRVLKDDIQVGELVVLDYESSWGGDAVDFCKRWLDRVAAGLGFKPLIYLNLSLTKQHNWSSVINAGYGLWLAQWTYDSNGNYDTTQPWPFAAMQQYSNKGQVPGIPAVVDLDVFFGTVDQFKAYGKPNAAHVPVITKEDHTDTEVIPFNKVSQEDASLPVGTSYILTPGVNGLRTIVTEITLTDGVQTDSRTVSDNTVQPTDEVTVVGTKQLDPTPTPDKPDLLQLVVDWVVMVWKKIIIGVNKQ